MMPSKSINIIIAIAAFTVLGLFVVQIRWAQDIIELEERQFNHKVKIALTNAGYNLRLIHHSSINRIQPVKQIDRESFVVEVQDIVNPSTIDSLLQIEFAELGVDQHYKIAIYDCFTDSVVYSHSGSGFEETVAAKDYGVNWDINSYNFGVIFPELKIFQNEFKIWMVVCLVVGGVSAFFVFIIIAFIRQKKLDLMKTDFINNMTHELKTPISTISLSAKVLTNPKIIEQPQRLFKYAEIIQEENNRLKTQVEKVLQIAFFEKENFQLELTKVDILEVIESAKKPYEIALEEKNGTIEVIGNSLMVELDQHHFTNVISNLLDNAIKYSSDSPIEIKVTIQKIGNRVKIFVSDNGIGMGEYEAKNVFKKFYRVPTGNLHNVKGFGIGLSYVKLMVDLHQGEINLQSTLGKGTTFEISIPIEQNTKR